MSLYLLCLTLLWLNGFGHGAAQNSSSLTTTNIEGRIEAIPHAAPYLVSVSSSYKKHVHSCGGVIVSQSWVISLSNCFEYFGGDIILAGVHDIHNPDEYAQRRNVDFIRRHPLFYAYFKTGIYDIMCMHVSEPFEFNFAVQPVILPLGGKQASGNVRLYGWRITKDYKVQAHRMKIIDDETCNKDLSESNALRENEFCTIPAEYGTASCSGGKGSALVIEREGVPAELVGLLKRNGAHCLENNKPTIYLNIGLLADWIRDVQAAYAGLY